MNWLFLRGLAREQRHWDDFPERFRAVMPEAQIHCLDFPGIGTELTRASPWTIQGIMEDLRERWLSLRDAASGPWCLFSISLGSMTGLRWIYDHPSDFERLVIVNTSSAGESGFLERLTPNALSDLGRFVLRRGLESKEGAILDMVSNLREDRERIARDWASYSPPLVKRLETFSRQITAASLFRLPEGPPPRPVLVLNSARDRMVDPACSREIARRLDAPIEIHPTAGHDLPLDAGTWVGERVRDWIAIKS